MIIPMNTLYISKLYLVIFVCLQVARFIGLFFKFASFNCNCNLHFNSMTTLKKLSNSNSNKICFGLNNH